MEPGFTGPLTYGDQVFHLPDLWGMPSSPFIVLTGGIRVNGSLLSSAAVSGLFCTSASTAGT
ncbi:hypothetical protein GBA52_017651 [Prunus armeniaca]|nr:hypothetical protein GBA52_017651 [Prunus armeniaca]